MLPAALEEAHELGFFEDHDGHDFQPDESAAFWARASGGTIETQPIVFLGSEGALCVIARNLDDYLWLLANGVGPLEMVDGLHRVPEQIPALVALARRHTGTSSRPLGAVISAAEAELPALTALIESVTG
ncbi:hypothetical protein DMB66_31250 [Actinoplanes sp. ATCC 53533]|nr:hypothetical protein DMB66_31250 [Actinoplanes sp. ATCC 53533]